MFSRIVKGFWGGVLAGALVAATGGWAYQFLPVKRQVAYQGHARFAGVIAIASLPGTGISGATVAYLARPRR